jgi:hypothetical protein
MRSLRLCAQLARFFRGELVWVQQSSSLWLESFVGM